MVSGGAYPKPVYQEVDQGRDNDRIKGCTDIERDDNLVPVTLEPVHGERHITDTFPAEDEIAG